MSALLRALFNQPSKPTQKLAIFKPLSDDEIQAQTDRTNAKCAFHDVIGQDGSVEEALDLVYNGLKHPHHVTSVYAILLHGGKSNGKTMLAKLMAKALGRTMLELDSGSIKSIDQLFERIEATCQDAEMPLVKLGVRNGLDCYKCPNIVVFFDEIHNLPDLVSQLLLKALEGKDRILCTKRVSLDCSNVLWIGATTDRGDLFDAFESRFYKIQMLSYTLAEVTKIVKLNFPKWSDQECETVARLCGQIVREALEFAKAADANAERRKCSRLEALENVRKQRKLLKNGMTIQQVWALRALAETERGLNYEQLARACQCKVAELKSYVLPRLLLNTVDRPAAVAWTGARSYITEQGRNDLATVERD